VWFANFQAKLPDYAASLGLGVPVRGNVTADYLMYQYVVNLAELGRQEYAERILYKNAFANGPSGRPSRPRRPTRLSRFRPRFRILASFRACAPSFSR
jgi:hypothetical protein